MKRLLGIAIFSTDAILMAYNLNLLYGKPHVYVLSAVLQISGCCDFVAPGVKETFGWKGCENSYVCP